MHSTTLRPRTLSRIAAAAVLLGCAAAVPAHALSISVVPSASVVESGGTVDLAVVVDGLDAADEIVGSYDLDLVFDPAAFAFTSIVYGSAFGPADLVFAGETVSAGRVDFSLLSLLDDGELGALQGNSVTLATLAFRAVAPGSGTFSLDPLSFPGIAVNGVGAALLEFATITGATVRVNARVEVPEPATAPLALLALAAVAAMRTRRLARGQD